MVNIAMFTNNKYSKLYFVIVNRAKNRILPDTKIEVHHIIPRSLGGSEDQSNLVKLTLREHWICHRLLVKMLDNPIHLRKMYNALFIMAVKDYRKINSRTYQRIKENVVPWNKGLLGIYHPPLNENAKEKLSKLWKGTTRPQSHKDAMKRGWDKIKQEGYSPWNKGLSGLNGPCQPVILLTPDGKQIEYKSLKAACKDQNLIYTKMSSVNSGKLDHYKGWKVKKVSKE